MELAGRRCVSQSVLHYCTARLSQQAPLMATQSAHRGKREQGSNAQRSPSFPIHMLPPTLHRDCSEKTNRGSRPLAGGVVTWHGWHANYFLVTNSCGMYDGQQTLPPLTYLAVMGPAAAFAVVTAAGRGLEAGAEGWR